MPKREFLMLAHDYDARKHSPCGYYMSEKIDGIRCFWDGGISRGLACSEVPWANVTKHGRYLVPPKATGLWTRYGQAIQAPAWWVDGLPWLPIDGELTMGRGTFQDCLSCSRKLVPVDSEWRKVKYLAFDTVPLMSVFNDGKINNTNFKKEFEGIINWIRGRFSQVETVAPESPFYSRLTRLHEWVNRANIDHAQVLQQVQLPNSRSSANELLELKLAEVETNGGEGVMLRSPISLWNPFRTYDLLKVKRLKDDEGQILGYRWGEPTDVERTVAGDRTDKMLGLMGSAVVQMKSGITFNLSGFTEAERVMAVIPDHSEVFRLMDFEGRKQAAKLEGIEHPGEQVPPWITNPQFPRGSKITFRYRELSRDGVPKEARYWRVHTED